LAWNTGTLATAWLNILLTRLTDARAANLDNLDVAGLVASQADVGALATSSAVGDIQTAVDAIKALTDLLSVTGDVLDQSYNALLVDPPPTTISPSSMFGLAGGSVANTLTLLDRFTALRAAYIDLLPGIDTDIDAILAGTGSTNVSIVLGAIEVLAKRANMIADPRTLEMFATESKTFSISARDANDELVDFTGMTLRFVVIDGNTPPTGKFQVEGSGITIGTTTASIEVTETESANVSNNWHWLLWVIDATNGDQVLGHGPFEIRPAKQDTE